MLAPQPHSLLIDPLLSLDAFVLHIIRRRDPMALERLHARVVAGPDEVDDAVSGILALLAGRGDDPVSARAEDPVRVLDCGVAEVHNGAARFGLDPEPFAGHVWLERTRLARGFRPYL